MRHVAKIRIANNYVIVSDFYGEFKERVIRPFCRMHLSKSVQVPIPGTRKKTWKISHVFARSNHDQTEFRLLKATYKEFKEFAQRQGYNPTRIQELQEVELSGRPVKFTFTPKFENPRDGQEEWINYQVAPGPLKVNNDNTGSGKTYMSAATMVRLGVRTVITIQPRYVVTWIVALNEILGLEMGDILLWERDVGLLPKALQNPDLNPKVIILTLTRVDLYIKGMKENPSWPCMDEIYGSLECGLRIIDEGHEDAHRFCLSMLYGNFSKTVVNSATLKADDPFLNKIYKYMFPIEIRLREAADENYIDITALLYDINPRKFKLKTQQMGSYNDMVWEDSILSYDETTQLYFDLVKYTYNNYYLDFKEPKTKLLYFFSRINMCKKMHEMFLEEYPGEDIVTYTGEDNVGKDANKLKYLQHEMIITTPGSCGTGKDIPGLITVVCFHNASSTQRGKQMIGRLRDTIFKLFGNRIPARFVFVTCISVEKQKEYYSKRKITFAPKQKTFKTIDSGLRLGFN